MLFAAAAEAEARLCGGDCSATLTLSVAGRWFWKLPLMVRAATGADVDADDGEVNNGVADDGDGVGEPARLPPKLLAGPNGGDANCADKSAADVETVWWALVGRAAKAEAEVEACISGGVDGGEKN